MNLISQLKSTSAKTIAKIICGNDFLEKTLCLVCGNSFTRNKLKMGAIAHGYLSLGRKEIRMASIGKYRIYVNISEYAGLSLYFFGQPCEIFSVYLASKLVNLGDTCTDIGANMGTYTFSMASCVGTEGKVFAFEPNPDLYNLLLDSLNVNSEADFISVNNTALYNRSGEKLKFYISQSANNSGTSSLVNHGVFVDEDGFVIVETTTLDDNFKSNSIEKCQLVKIDVERAELDVLKGMIKILTERKINYILLEQLAGSESQKLLYSLDYKGWLIDENQRKLVNIDKVEKEYFGNYVFVSPNILDKFKQDFFDLIQE